MAYKAETLEPIVVNEAKKLLVKDFNKAEVGEIAKETIAHPRLVAKGTINEYHQAIIDYFAEGTFPKIELKGSDGLYLFTYGNSYVFIPITANALLAVSAYNTPIVTPIAIRDSTNVVRPGYLKVYLANYSGDDNNHSLVLEASTSKTIDDNQHGLPEGWGFSLYKIA